jgi:hypothetical protein
MRVEDLEGAEWALGAVKEQNVCAKAVYWFLDSGVLDGRGQGLRSLPTFGTATFDHRSILRVRQGCQNHLREEVFRRPMFDTFTRTPLFIEVSEVADEHRARVQRQPTAACWIRAVKPIARRNLGGRDELLVRIERPRNRERA